MTLPCVKSWMVSTVTEVCGGPETLGSNVREEGELNSIPTKAEVPSNADALPTKKPVGQEMGDWITKKNNYSIVEIIKEVSVPRACSFDEEMKHFLQIFTEILLGKEILKCDRGSNIDIKGKWKWVEFAQQVPYGSLKYSYR